LGKIGKKNNLIKYDMKIFYGFLILNYLFFDLSNFVSVEEETV
jgi:hypothetical protein